MPRKWYHLTCRHKLDQSGDTCKQRQARHLAAHSSATRAVLPGSTNSLFRNFTQAPRRSLRANHRTDFIPSAASKDDNWLGDSKPRLIENSLFTPFRYVNAEYGWMFGIFPYFKVWEVSLTFKCWESWSVRVLTYNVSNKTQVLATESPNNFKINFRRRWFKFFLTCILDTFQLTRSDKNVW